MVDNVLVDIAMNLVHEVFTVISPDLDETIRNIFRQFTARTLGYDEARNQVLSIVNNSVSIDKINSIIRCDDTPLPPIKSSNNDSSMKRKKTRTWTSEEDNRLILGIFKYGEKDWQSIINFVGSSRTRSQCSQRWYRVLDPKISHQTWTEEEDAKLNSLVEKYGTKVWVKIASEMQNRSDVQCRYRYSQISGEINNKDTNHYPNHIQKIDQNIYMYPQNSSPLRVSWQINPNQSVRDDGSPMSMIPNPQYQMPLSMSAPFREGNINPYNQIEQRQMNPLYEMPMRQYAPGNSVQMEQIHFLPPNPQQIPALIHKYATMHEHVQPTQQFTYYGDIPKTIKSGAEVVEGKNIPIEPPIDLKNSYDTFKSSQLFDSSVWSF